MGTEPQDERRSSLISHQPCRQRTIGAVCGASPSGAPARQSWLTGRRPTGCRLTYRCRPRYRPQRAGSTQDGALDWMGVAHMLGIDGTTPELAAPGPRRPMLSPEQVLFFANDNVEAFERRVIEELGIADVRLAEVAVDPSGTARVVAIGWAQQFERLLVHLDVDVLDFIDMPLAENNRRNAGLRFDQLMAALGPLLCAPTGPRSRCAR